MFTYYSENMKCNITVWQDGNNRLHYYFDSGNTSFIVKFKTRGKNARNHINAYYHGMNDTQAELIRAMYTGEHAYNKNCIYTIETINKVVK